MGIESGSSMNDAYTDWKHWEAGQFAQCSRSDGRYFSWCLAQAGLGSPPTRVLEVGFGNGAFLGYCRDQGWSATGIETSEALLDRAASAGFSAFASVEELPRGQTFEVIAAFDVLEHLPFDQGQEMLAALRTFLSPQGAILVRVPNGDSPFGRAYQHGDRTHVETYGSEKLRQLCALVQLRIVHAGEAPCSSQHRKPRTVRTFVGAVLKRALDWIIGYAYFGRRVDLSPNLFVVIKPIGTPGSGPDPA
jgi:2-polyprenyl-3-methyl-5-hydroxy-6-metoxy-1,4-benzoquinol methylase